MSITSYKHILTLGKESIRLEADALVHLSESLGQGFVDAIGLMHQSRGRIILSGVGKSALIAKKIVATFNSINISSIFIHASDALHGDLGIVQSEDVVIILSKSGETAEIKTLVPALKSRSNHLISIVANPNCYLANHSDIVIVTPVTREADPNNLAPTVSTMSQLAIGDAMATCLIQLNDFKREDFALLHPAGMIGKQLHMIVSDLRKLHGRPCVSQEANIHEVILEISSKRLGATGVLNDDGHLCGIITDGDLRRMLEKEQDYRRLSAADIMTSSPKTIHDQAKAIEALALMRQYNITQLLVVSDQTYLGVIHIHDLIREGFE